MTRIIHLARSRPPRGWYLCRMNGAATTGFDALFLTIWRLHDVEETWRWTNPKSK
jgi:hypothetical protein